MSDQFVKIAEGFHIAEDCGLVCPKPLTVRGKDTFLASGNVYAFEPYKKPDTKEELDELVQKMRVQYAPYMKDYSPAIEPMEKKIPITEFIYTDYEGEKSEVTIPHYGGPAEKCTVSYETEFSLNEFGEDCVYICFKGVDYTADVFVNDRYVGSHKGFFSPFEFCITEAVKVGNNTLKVIATNDITQKDGGEKIYAATGLGWDDAYSGWHHCPPGVGIYNDVFVEIRKKQHLTDIFPRFSSGEGEFWIECNSEEYEQKDVAVRLSVYGKNFKDTVTEGYEFVPTTGIEAGANDTFTVAKLLAENRLGKQEKLKLGVGFNRFVIPFQIPEPKIWRLEEPYLYTVVAELIVDGEVTSVKKRNFGIRSFTQDLNSEPKGKFYLNGEEIRLFGANTMGLEQMDVFRNDYEQLIDDILLAKICNMNFLRITQRPVQEEIYDYCDMLGLMVQTDLPLFGVIRINSVNEVLRQTTEMEHLVRSHPCCIIDSYINEPFPNANNMSHRMLDRKGLMTFFEMADRLVHMENPDRVIKHVDGDYDPPSESLPDNHCYTMWYNGHGMDLGRLHKGYWLGIKEGWHCGCGEFGSEGLEDVSVMKKYYPKEWLKEPFSPKQICGSQTQNNHGFFYETPKSLEEWVEDSQTYQSFATEIMTSAFRRNPYMNTFAIHLFIDAWPSGWMKTIMDCDRNPKKAFFTYMDCLSPIYCNLRSDRLTFWDNDNIKLEAYLCNETKVKADTIRYFVVCGDEIIASAVTNAEDGVSQGTITFAAPKTAEREIIQVYMGAFAGEKLLHYTKKEYTVFAYEALCGPKFISYEEYDRQREAYDSAVKEGRTLFILPMKQGEYEIAGKAIRVKDCRMNPVYAVSRDTGHRCVAGLQKNDFGYFYDSQADQMTPLLYATFEADGVTPILLASNRKDSDDFVPCYACGSYPVGKGNVVLCQADLEHKTENPVVVKFLNQLGKEDNKNK